MTHQHQEEGHACLLCGAKAMFGAMECRNCGGVLKVSLVVVALVALVYYVL